ncbi:p25-alpha family protein [Babesia bovis T2Bo]|uniref:P25-alpha family protein n=1 Tax=Babesia bovis TaxID=5865 RepID=A7ARN3_BABBO|nr:p25-alpha family protein [Babesia bovis T2Bo]EDO07202.1 p25-alpha family protein [Babesia bovis T2Bo]|eukprot:XP_001610770.1 hypothetical protein [Babesia bovis T2Bo]
MASSELHQIYQHYINKSTGQLEGRMFVKIFKQANLLDQKLNTNDLDIIFVKHRTKGSRTMDFSGFEKAIQAAAVALGIDYQEIVERVLKAGAPVYAGTETLPVRFYDDKNSYTGVHAHGGPSVK